MVEPNFLGSGTETGARAWNWNLRVVQILHWFSVFFSTKSFWSRSQKLLHICSRIWSKRIWMPFSGTQSLKFKFWLHDPAMGLVDAWRHGFWAFSGPKKTIFASYISGNRDTEPLPMNRDFSRKTSKVMRLTRKKTKAGNVEKLKPGLPHIYKIDFILFQYLMKKICCHRSYLYFFNFIRGTQCKIYLQNSHRRKMQNSNKRIAQLEISILFHYCMCILAKFSTCSRSWKPILKINAFSYFQNRVGTLWYNKTFVETQYTYRGLTRGARR